MHGLKQPGRQVIPIPSGAYPQSTKQGARRRETKFSGSARFFDDGHYDPLQPYLFFNLGFTWAESPGGPDRRLPRLQPRQLPNGSPCWLDC